MWKDIPGYNGYQVSNRGEVRSKDRWVTREDGRKKFFRGMLLTPNLGRSGYVYVQLTVNGKNHTKVVHRLVATAFIPNPEDKQTVNHRDENRLNNCVENLEWMTMRENVCYNDGYSRRVKSLCKAIEQYTVNGDFVRVWSGAQDAARVMGKSPSSIRECAAGKRKAAYGYVWRFVDQNDTRWLIPSKQRKWPCSYRSLAKQCVEN